MKIYKDKDYLTEATELDLGIVPAGISKSFTFYIKNDSNAYLKDLNFKVEHKEVKITKNITNMVAGEKDTLIIEWSPSITLKQGLKTQLLIEGKEVWS